jgi:uncharacterized protein YjbJ (UPF0337 family)
MNQEAFEWKWDRMDEKVQAKWGKLTRDERNVLAGRRRSLQVKLHQLDGISEEDVDRAISDLEKGRL